uniref:Uncharacterized protein n=1 Tax=Aegilops tauschii subsp. strangulata TaxID=200361 RepID=A0A452ZIR2_AEGTS
MVNVRWNRRRRSCNGLVPELWTRRAATASFSRRVVGGYDGGAATSSGARGRGAATPRLSAHACEREQRCSRGT